MEDLKWKVARKAWLKYKDGGITLEEFWILVRGVNGDY